MATPFHSRYYAEQLIARNSSDEVSRLARSLFSAKVDLNPHQVDAALFVFRSPLSFFGVVSVGPRFLSF